VKIVKGKEKFRV